ARGNSARDPDRRHKGKGHRGVMPSARSRWKVCFTFVVLKVSSAWYSPDGRSLLGSSPPYSAITSLVGRRSQFNRVKPGAPGAFRFATGCPVDFVTTILISSPVNSRTQTVNNAPSGGFCPR